MKVGSFNMENSDLILSRLADKDFANKVLEAMCSVAAEIFENSNNINIDIPKDFINYLDLFKLIEQPIGFGRRVILAIDGRCGAGKTTLAKIIAKVYGGDFVSTDDFYLPFELRTPERMQIPGGHINYERFIRQVIEPIKAGQTTLEYENFNCFTNTATPLVKSLSSKVIVIEGSYSLHPWIRELYSISTFLDIPDEIQQDRILKRNGPEKLKMFKDMWIPFEDNYRKAYGIDKYCNIIMTQGCV